MSTHATDSSTRGTSPRVLCLTYDLDPTADFVLTELNIRGVGFWRIDLARFAQTTISAELTMDGSWSGRWEQPQARGIDLSQVRMVWWRKPTAFQWPGTMSKPEQRFAESQARQALSGLFRSMPQVLWVNAPDVVADCTKPRQLSVAAWAGLPVPRTLITSDPSAVEPFARSCDSRIITKVLGPIVHTENGQRGQMYTRRVEPSEWGDPRIGLTAHLFQQEITDKAYELRVTCVAGEYFPVQIHANSSAGKLDWRSDSSNLTYTPAKLPTFVDYGLTTMLNELGLIYAAVDFIVDKAGTHWLIDVNPAEQWAWIDLTRQPVTNALADLFEKGSR